MADKEENPLEQLQREIEHMFNFMYTGPRWKTDARVQRDWPLLLEMGLAHSSETQAACNVKLAETDWNKAASNFAPSEKINFIKHIRTETGAGLKEARDIAEKVWEERGWN